MSDRPKLIQVDLGPYASSIYKFQLFTEYYMTDNKALKFLHFNNDQLNLEKRSKAYREALQSRTVAALAVSPHAVRRHIADYLALQAGQELLIDMVVGVTALSKDDNYSRKTGRDEAVKQMAEISVKVESVNMNDTHLYVNLAPVKGVSLTLRVNRKTGFSSVLGQITGPVRS